jgi:hypothetical protein
MDRLLRSHRMPECHHVTPISRLIDLPVDPTSCLLAQKAVKTSPSRFNYLTPSYAYDLWKERNGSQSMWSDSKLEVGSLAHTELRECLGSGHRPMSSQMVGFVSSSIIS